MGGKDDDPVSRDYVDYRSGYQSNFFERNYNDEDEDAEYYLSIDQAFGGRGPEAPRAKRASGKSAMEMKTQILMFEDTPISFAPIAKSTAKLRPCFYSELKWNLQSGDVLCMKPCKHIVKASEKVWIHNPLDDIGTTNGTGQNSLFEAKRGRNYGAPRLGTFPKVRARTGH